MFKIKFEQLVHSFAHSVIQRAVSAVSLGVLASSRTFSPLLSLSVRLAFKLQDNLVFNSLDMQH